MKNTKRIMRVAVLCGSALLVAGVATADPPAELEISPAFAHVEIQPALSVVAVCEGVDGVYTVLHVTGQGPITSPDPRVTGTFIADALIFDNPNTGKGVSTDNFTVIDPATRAVKMKGTAWALDAAPPAAIKSLALADLADGTHFVALATVNLPAPGTTNPLIIEYGGAGSGDSADRAVLISGDCARTVKHLGFR